MSQCRTISNLLSFRRTSIKISKIADTLDWMNEYYFFIIHVIFNLFLINYLSSSEKPFAFLTLLHDMPKCCLVK
jgi:hypothetical protein